MQSGDDVADVGQEPSPAAMGHARSARSLRTRTPPKRGRVRTGGATDEAAPTQPHLGGGRQSRRAKRSAATLVCETTPGPCPLRQQRVGKGWRSWARRSRDRDAKAGSRAFAARPRQESFDRRASSTGVPPRPCPSKGCEATGDVGEYFRAALQGRRLCPALCFSLCSRKDRARSRAPKQ